MDIKLLSGVRDICVRWPMTVGFALVGAGGLVPLALVRVAPDPVPLSDALMLSLPMLVLAGATAMLVLCLASRRSQQSRGDAPNSLLDHMPDAALITDTKGGVVAVSARAMAVVAHPLETDVGGLLGLSEAEAHTLLDVQDGCIGQSIQLDGVAYTLTVQPISHGQLLWSLARGAQLERAVQEPLSDPEQADEVMGLAHLSRLTVGRNGAVLWMNARLRAQLDGKRRNVSDIFADALLEHGAPAALKTAKGLREVLVVEVGRTAGRREILLAAPPTNAGLSTGADIDRIPVAILACDGAGVIHDANRAARFLIFGPDCAEGELPAHLTGLLEGLGRSMTDWLHHSVRGDGHKQTEFMRLLGQTSERFVQVSIAPRASAQDQDRIYLVLSDATDFKALEAKFAQSQKMQAIGQLAGGVAHDFNNLLTAISGHCDLLLLRHDPQDPEYADLTQINQNANRAAALVGQLLAFSRKQTLNPETLDLRDTLSELTHLLNRLVGEKVRLSVSHDPELLPIRADKRQLEQVIMNLVVNARDAMPSGGDVRITTQTEHVSHAMTRERALIPAGTYVVVNVTDQGRGIAPELHHKVFEPFYTSKRAGEGTGLGLSTVYGIVKQSGGFVFLDSDLGVGTRFTVMFPAEAKKAQKPDAIRAPLHLRHGEGTVLVVEDEAPVRAFATRALQMRGYDVVDVSSAEEALDKLAAPDFSVDVIVTDVIMPGMDGPTWVAEALKTRPNLRVIFVSGYAEETFEEARRSISRSVFLPKPFSLNALTATVQQQIGDAA